MPISMMALITLLTVTLLEEKVSITSLVSSALSGYLFL